MIVKENVLRFEDMFPHGMQFHAMPLTCFLIFYCYCVIIIVDSNNFIGTDFSYSDFIPTFGMVSQLLIVCSLLDVRIIWFNKTERPLKKKAKDIFDDFTSTCKVRYRGMSNIIHHNVSGVKYPVDFFIKHFYDRFYPTFINKARLHYRRVNPTLELKLDNLEKYAEPNPMVCSQAELNGYADEIVNEMRDSEGYQVMLNEINENFNDRRFDHLSIDGSSAAGYPYKQGVKRRDVMDESIAKANEMLDSKDAFNAYAAQHHWFSTGRARMISNDKEDKGRLILYAGFAFTLIAMLFVQPLARFMNVSCSWCAVGMSWMHGGAEKFAKFFKCEAGNAPKGFRYVSVDIKEWDTKLHPSLLRALKRVHSKVIEDAKVDDSAAKRYLRILSDMFNAVVLMPMGHLFQLYQGMKSGWSNTANDNTLIHEIVFRAVQCFLGCPIHHLLYGDDNFMLVPDYISDAEIKTAYARVGCVVGRIHSSHYIGDVDFLSKFVTYQDGMYFIYRPAIETHARLIMPEELNPAHRSRPDPIIAAERVMGHLLDNPFNEEVRMVCTNLLTKLNTEYGVGRIEVTVEMTHKYPWKGFGIEPQFMPIIPTIEFIEELYGVSPSCLKARWPDMPSPLAFDWEKEAVDCNSFYSAIYYSFTVLGRLGNIGMRRLRPFIKSVSPFCVPPNVYGTHAARLECAMRMCDIEGKNFLDLGAHPGACTASMLKIADSVTCVSLRPDGCDSDHFCPYIFRDDKVILIEEDANLYQPTRFFDVIHDDVDFSGGRTRHDEENHANDVIARAMRYAPSTACYIFTLRDINPSIMLKLYDLYVIYGRFDMLKPHFSNPWRLEFIVILRKNGGDRRRKNTFLKALYHMLNTSSYELVEWSTLISNKMHDFIQFGKLDECPHRHDSQLQANIALNYTFKAS